MAPYCSSAMAPTPLRMSFARSSGRIVSVVPLSRMAATAMFLLVRMALPVESLIDREVKATVKDVRLPESESSWTGRPISSPVYLEESTPPNRIEPVSSSGFC
jgi:hypothetical protein